MTREDGSGRGDDVYQPDPAADRDIHEDTGVLDPEDTLDDRDDDEVLDEGFSPPQRPVAVEDTGTTDREQHTGESLDQRLARERPEPQPPPDDGLGDFAEVADELLTPEARGSRSGRPAGPDGGSGSRRDGRTARGAGPDSAEEAAVHVVRDLEEAIEDDGL